MPTVSNGAFDALIGDVLPGGLAWQIDYLSDTDGRGLVQLTFDHSIV